MKSRRLPRYTYHRSHDMRSINNYPQDVLPSIFVVHRFFQELPFKDVPRIVLFPNISSLIRTRDPLELKQYVLPSVLVEHRDV